MTTGNLTGNPISAHDLASAQAAAAICESTANRYAIELRQDAALARLCNDLADAARNLDVGIFIARHRLEDAEQISASQSRRGHPQREKGRAAARLNPEEKCLRT